MMDRPSRLSLIGANQPTGVSMADYADVVQAVRDLTGTWSVERDIDDRGRSSISIIQEGVRDEDTVVYLIWYERGMYRTGLGQGDFYANLGSYDGVDGAIMAMRSAAGGSADVSVWMEGLLLRPHPAG